MEFPHINDVKNRLSKAALSGKENVNVKTDDLTHLLLYVAMQTKDTPPSQREEFMQGIKELCLQNGYTETNWNCGVHDWNELYNIGYRQPTEAFEYALQCE